MGRAQPAGPPPLFASSPFPSPLILPLHSTPPSCPLLFQKYLLAQPSGAMTLMQPANRSICKRASLLEPAWYLSPVFLVPPCSPLLFSLDPPPSISLSHCFNVPLSHHSVSAVALPLQMTCFSVSLSLPPSISLSTSSSLHLPMPLSLSFSTPLSSSPVPCPHSGLPSFSVQCFPTVLCV